MSGTLFIVATPIGNLSDLTFRAVETLKAVDIVASEDTRRTENLLRHLGIQKRPVRYDEHTHHRAATKLLDALKSGKSVALVSDAGTPGVSDPGARLVADARDAGVGVLPVPGPNAVAAAVSASGFSGDAYVFLGFLPKRPGRSRRILREAFGLGRTLVLFESPYRIRTTLAAVQEVAPAARVFLAREMTKVHEEYTRGSLSDAIAAVAGEPKGEFVVVVEGGDYDVND